jgi:hypothetical protein
MEKIPKTRYNGHIFNNLVYDTELKMLIYKENEIPWKVTKISSFSKKINDNKAYVYNSVIIPDEKGIKRKIFKEKLDKMLTYKTESESNEQTPTDDIHQQLIAFYEQKDKEEKELIEKYLKSTKSQASEIIKVKGNTWLIK